MRTDTGADHTHIMAIANQKGGVGKTTTATNLAAALAELGARVVLVDIDPQGNASTGLGVEQKDRTPNTYDLMFSGAPLSDILRPTAHRLLSVAPATGDLSSADVELVSKERRSYLLHDALRHQPKADGPDFILIDCPPSLSLLTINALVAAHSVLVPLQTEFFALEGLSQLMLTVRTVRAASNPDLRIEGVVLTMADSRNRLSQQVEADARATLGDLVFRTVVPRAVRLSEAPSFGQSILAYDPASKGAAAYRALAQELVTRNGFRFAQMEDVA
jgi:chromosome partitioning protein